MKIEIDQILAEKFTSDKSLSIPVLITCNPVFVDQVITDLKAIKIDVPDHELNQFGVLAIQINGQIVDDVLQIKGILSIELDHEVQVEENDGLNLTSNQSEEAE